MLSAWYHSLHPETGSANITLEESSERAAPPPETFNGVLWAPQATLLAAMLRLERRPVLLVEEGKSPLRRICSARVRARFSFGKTVLCVALMCANPAGAAQLPLPVSRIRQLGDGITSATATFTRMVDATLILASPSVVPHWIATIQRFAPHLRTFVVQNVHTLRRLRSLIDAGKLNAIDVVLVKAGDVTTNFAVATSVSRSGIAGTPACRISRGVCDLTEGLVWKRLIVDDYDTIRANLHAMVPMAHFTWLLTATSRTTSHAKRRVVPFANTTKDCARLSLLREVRGLGAACDVVLRCSAEFENHHIATFAPRFRRIVVAGGRAADMLQAMGVPPEIVELVAAGATASAATALGITASNPGDLVRRVLEQHSSKFADMNRRLRRVSAVRALVNTRSQRHVLFDGAAGDLAPLASLLRTGGSVESVRSAVDSIRCGPAFDQMLATVRAQAIKQRDEAGANLRRMRENIAEGECQVCAVELDGETFVVNCCQTILCHICVADQKRYIKRCPSCSRPVDPITDLIHVQGAIQLDIGEAALDTTSMNVDERLEEAFGDNKTCADDSLATDSPANPNAPQINDPRLRALHDVIKGGDVEAVSDEKKVDPFVAGLLAGREQVDRPADAPEKFLVFATVAETGRAIADMLTEAGIANERLWGTLRAKHAAVERFRHTDAKTVLVIASNRDCAGIHLPEATTAVLYHHHVDNHVAAQCVGRAQRVGRDCSLEIVEILDRYEQARHYG